MTDVGILLTGFLFLCLGIAGVWLRVWTRRLKAENHRLRTETDWEKLQRKFGLKTIRAERSVKNGEVARSDDPARELARKKQDLIQSVVSKMIDEGYIFLTTENLPSKPTVELSAEVIVCKVPSDRDHELSDVKGEELFEPRNQQAAMT